MAKTPRNKERYEVLFEEVASKVQLVVEGHSTLDQRIEVLRRDVGGVKEELGHVEKAVAENNRHLEILINRFEAHEHAHTR